MDRRDFLWTGLLGALAACERAVESRAPSPPPASPPPSSPPPPSPSGSPSTSATATPARPAVALTVLCREAWGAAPPGDGFEEHTIRRLMIHHSAVVLGDNRHAPARLRQHQRHHQGQGWPDIAYHLGVDRRGNAYDLRPARFRGDTFTAYDPAGYFLVLAEGDFDEERPTDAQLEGVARAFAWAAREFDAPPATLIAHRDRARTSCPGDALYARLPELRARVERLSREGIERIESCGPPAASRVRAIEAGSA